MVKMLDKTIIAYLDYLKYEKKLSTNTLKSYTYNLTQFNKVQKNPINATIEDIRKFLYQKDANARTTAH